MSEFNLPPVIAPNGEDDVLRAVSDLVRAYNELQAKFQNLPNVFVRGRVIERVPSAFNDTVSGEFIGDQVTDGTGRYEYIDDSGTPKWAKITINKAF